MDSPSLPGDKTCKPVVKHPGSQRSEKFKMAKCAGKVMATMFWDRRAVLLADFVEEATTINAASYYATLERLRTAIKNALDCSRQVLCFCTIALGPVYRLQHHTGGAAGGQCWEHRNTVPMWRRVISISFPLLRIIFLVTCLQVTTTSKQLLWGC